MKSFFVKALGGLDNRTPEHNVNAANGTIAQYWDPFRARPGAIAPCFGFKDITIENWPNNGIIYLAFMMGGREFVVLAGGWCYYIIDNELFDMSNAYLNGYPTSMYVDNNPYSIGKKTESNYIEYFNAYFFGPETTSRDVRDPKRLVLAKKYHEPEDYPNNPEYLWYTLDMALETFPAIMDFNITESGAVGWDDTDWNDEWHYFLVIEDYMGNLITKLPENKDVANAYHQYYSSGNDKPPRLDIDWEELGSNVTETLGIRKIHIYRVNYTTEHALTPVEDIQDLYARTRWRWTKDIREDLPWSGVLTDIDPSSIVLGDNIYPGYDAMEQWLTNINLANDAIGVHNGALWASKGKEIYFSEYSLSAPYGTRPLNFPTVNRWRFEGIGDIAEIQSVNNTLVVFGTEGVSTLSGTYLDNYYEKKVSDIGILKTRQFQYERSGGKDYVNATTLIDDRVYFLNNEGIPCVYFNGDVAKIPGMRIPISGDVVDSSPDYEVHDCIDTARYRDSWMVSNGTSIYLYDVNRNTWHEWPEAVWRFIYGADPYYEDSTLTPGGVGEYSYLRFYKFDAPDDKQPREYATDGTVQSSVWKTPLIKLDGVKRIAYLKLYWRYNLIYRYENKDSDADDRVAQSISASIDIYLDENLSSVKTVTFAPSEIVNGSYYTSLLLNVRGEKLSFKLSGTAMKYLQLTGYEIFYEDKGVKRFG